MNNETSTSTTAEAGEVAIGKPTKLWLWCLATIQLLAVFVMAKVGVHGATIKYSGFGILFLCSMMDIKAVKSTGYKVPFWWWGLAIFLPPVYLVVRVLKTDTAPVQRFVRFAPALVWFVIFVALTVLLSGCAK